MKSLFKIEMDENFLKACQDIAEAFNGEFGDVDNPAEGTINYMLQQVGNLEANISAQITNSKNSLKAQIHDYLDALVNKINTNIQGATLLASYGMFSESKIILRSAFETLVLFEYL